MLYVQFYIWKPQELSTENYLGYQAVLGEARRAVYGDTFITCGFTYLILLAN